MQTTAAPSSAPWYASVTTAEYLARNAALAREGTARRRAAGLPCGRVPLGYRIDPGTGRAAVDEAMAPLVRRAFRLATQSRLSVRAVAGLLEAEGYRLPSGKPVSPSSLHDALTSRFYLGAVPGPSEAARQTHAALVSKAEFERVQEVLSRRKRSSMNGKLAPRPNSSRSIIP